MKTNDESAEQVKSDSLPSVFFEMLQSFVTLGETQNLSLAVERLGVTRQTIRRHIKELERLKGKKLVETKDRRYGLTREGELAMSESLLLIERAQAWLSGKLVTPFELLSTEIELSDDSWMYAQQHQLIGVWSMAPPILQRGAEAWLQAKGELGHEMMRRIQPYTVVFRKFRNEWLIVEVGEKSAYGTWLGISLAKSELGRNLDLGEKHRHMVAHWHNPYDAVLNNGGLWYEHVCTSLPLRLGGEPMPVNYQRLVAACRFADGEPAVAVFSARTDRIEIPHMPQSKFTENLPENLMEFDI